MQILNKEWQNRICGLDTKLVNVIQGKETVTLGIWGFSFWFVWFLLFICVGRWSVAQYLLRTLVRLLPYNIAFWDGTLEWPISVSGSKHPDGYLSLFTRASTPISTQGSCFLVERGLLSYLEEGGLYDSVINDL